MVTIRQIQESLDYSGDHTLADLVDALNNGKARVFTAPDAWIAVSVAQMPARTVLAYWCAAGDLSAVKGLTAEVEEWARENGCTHAQMGGRPGWSRALRDLGWEQKYVTLEKEL